MTSPTKKQKSKTYHFCQI